MKILVINSCGKAKVGSHSDQPQCVDLDSPTKRAEAIKRFAGIAVPARDLYTGNQARLMRRAVDILRGRHEVNYYIISAGFGLLGEYFRVPPYECSFSDKGRGKIEEMSESMEIQLEMEGLPDDYDLIYLALGTKYLQTFDPNTLRSKSGMMVYFGKSESERNTLCIDPNTLLELDSGHFSTPLGNHLSNKASLLLNYAQYSEISDISFSDWWNQITKNIVNNDIQLYSTPSQRSVIKEAVSTEYNNRMFKVMGEEIKFNQKQKNELKDFVDSFSKSDINEIIDLTSGLDTVRTKQGQTRKEWVEKFSDREKGIREFHGKMTEFIREFADSTSYSVAKIKPVVLNRIRERQEEFGHDKYLLNSPRFSIMNTLINWVDNPELQEIKSVYKKRGSKSSVGVAEPNLDIRLSSWRQTDNRIEIGIELINRSNYPLQNILIELKGHDDYQIIIDDVSGSFANVEDGKLHIHFLKAGMDAQIPSEKYRMYSNSIIDSDDTVKAYITQDHTFKMETTTQEVTLLDDKDE